MSISAPVRFIWFQSARGVWRQSFVRWSSLMHGTGSNLHGACGGKGVTTWSASMMPSVPICTGRVEAKVAVKYNIIFAGFQSARGVWRQSLSDLETAIAKFRSNLHGACGGKVPPAMRISPAYLRSNLHGACGGKVGIETETIRFKRVPICTGRVEAKAALFRRRERQSSSNLHGACGGKVHPIIPSRRNSGVPICTGRVEAKAQNRPYKTLKLSSNLHGACGGKV